MSKKEQKRQPRKKPEAGKERPAAPERQPSGPPPAAFVAARHGTGTVEREARGFSMGELERAGVPYQAARRLGVRVDTRRRSVLERNVSSLKGWYSPPRKAEPEEAKQRRRKAAKRTTRATRSARA